MATDRKLAEIYFALLASSEPGCSDPATRPDDEQLAAFVEGSLPTETHSAAVRHLARCGDCYGRYADLAIACQPLTKTAAAQLTAAPSWLDRLVSHWKVASATLAGGAVAAIAIVAFVVGGGGGRLESELQRDLQSFAATSSGTLIPADKGFRPDAPVIAIPTEPTLSLLRHGIDDGYAIVAPAERSNTLYVGTDCVGDASSTAACREDDALAYATGLWLALVQAQCAGAPRNDLARDEARRLERLAQAPVAAMLAAIDATSTETLCTSTASLVAALGTP
jgi:hypothetical protein